MEISICTPHFLPRQLEYNAPQDQVFTGVEFASSGQDWAAVIRAAGCCRDPWVQYPTHRPLRASTLSLCVFSISMFASFAEVGIS